MTTEPGPATRRRQLGRQLRELRLAAGIRTMAAAATRSGLSRATISRIESAKQTILPRTVRLLCQTYGIGAPLIDHLAKLAAESEDRGWLLAYSDTMPNWFERFVGEEAEATEIWTYEAEFVPGLLQTADYCRAVSAVSSPDVVDEEVDRRVDFRLARQKLLERATPPQLRVVVNEAVLRRHVGETAVMREQLRHLGEMAKRPNITVQVLPFSAGAHPAMTSSFTMLHFPADGGEPTILVEVDSGALYPDRPADFERYTWMFGRLRDLALSPAESMALVSRVMEEL
ncbi:helix-turn-helix domain-containing protein [Actinophytocola glycyrrhizae]|uniref:Helix-turn-helix domain-containing protein n=1 Tax=Actinophytocola glycyrrhizae TaxID=2044873 RepID=A0ABV9S3A8_9PSEU